MNTAVRCTIILSSRFYACIPWPGDAALTLDTANGLRTVDVINLLSDRLLSLQLHHGLIFINLYRYLIEYESSTTIPRLGKRCSDTPGTA